MTEVILKTPIEMLYEWETKQPNRIFLRQPLQGKWIEYSWGEVARQARRMAQVLHDFGCRDGDRVALISKNCAHWIMADLAIMMAGCVSVPLYPTQQAESIEYVLKHSESKLIFVGKLDQWQKMEPGIPKGIPRIRFPYPDPMNSKYPYATGVMGNDSIDAQFHDQQWKLLWKRCP